MPEKWFANSKTIIFNVIVLVLAVAAALGFDSFVPTEEVTEASGLITALVVAAVPIINIILRTVTKSSVTWQKPRAY